MSLYANYIKERENKEILETDKGFATYAFHNDSCYIEDIYVLADHRKSGVAAEMADTITGIAKEKGCKKLYGSVVPTARGSTASLQVLISYGFKLESSSNNFILMAKDI